MRLGLEVCELTDGFFNAASPIEEEGGTPSHFGFMSFGHVETYVDLSVALESKGVFARPFNFWDKEIGCRIRLKLEVLNNLEKSVCVIQRTSSNLGKEEGCQKCERVLVVCK